MLLGFSASCIGTMEPVTPPPHCGVERYRARNRCRDAWCMTHSRLKECRVQQTATRAYLSGLRYEAVGTQVTDIVVAVVSPSPHSQNLAFGMGPAPGRRQQHR